MVVLGDKSITNIKGMLKLGQFNSGRLVRTYL